MNPILCFNPCTVISPSVYIESSTLLLRKRIFQWLGSKLQRFFSCSHSYFLSFSYISNLMNQPPCSLNFFIWVKLLSIARTSYPLLVPELEPENPAQVHFECCLTENMKWKEKFKLIHCFKVIHSWYKNIAQHQFWKFS